jgi:hypothetical protein
MTLRLSAANPGGIGANLLLLVIIAAFVASCVWWGLSKRSETILPSSSHVPQDPKVSAILFVALGAFQVVAGMAVFFYLGAFILAGAAYLGVGPLALPALLFALWGVFLGVRLIVRRNAMACRSASFWYLPIALFFLLGSIFVLGKNPDEGVKLLIAFVALLAMFSVMFVPVLPGGSLKAAKKTRAANVVR